MKKVEEYLRHAAECWEMAGTASAHHRKQLEQMAATWEQLAESRRRLIRRSESIEEDSAG